jgi:predicted RNase H-like nuclease
MAESVVGIDWAKRGWVAVALRGPGSVAVLTGPDLAALVARVPEAAAVAIDMPLGLPARTREADTLARAFVGVRRSSVFATPPREVLEAGSYAEANTIAVERIGKGVSQQAWALRHNITVVEALADADDRVIEVHPEVSFRRMAGAPLSHPKTTWNGQHARRALLARQGVELPEELGEGGEVPVADVLDAAAAAWSARRYANGTAESFPPGATRGRREVIWF